MIDPDAPPVERFAAYLAGEEFEPLPTWGALGQYCCGAISRLDVLPRRRGHRPDDLGRSFTAKMQ